MAVLMITVYIRGHKYECDEKVEFVLANKSIRYKCISAEGDIKYITTLQLESYQNYKKPKACHNIDCPWRGKRQR